MKRHITGQVMMALIVVLMLGYSVSYAATTIDYKGPLYLSTSKGTERVGHFEVNGKLAFCIQHEKQTPPKGTAVTPKVYENDRVRKVLYYGYGGPKQWSGFKNSTEGIVLTSLLLSEVNPESQFKIGHYNYITRMPTFRAYVNKNAVPSLKLSLSPSSVVGKFDESLGAQRTPDIAISGNGAGDIMFKVPEGTVLHNNKTGKDMTGAVSLKAGTTFYFKSVGESGPSEINNISATNAKYAPMVYYTSASNLQNLSSLRVVEDKTLITKLSVSWEKFGSIKLVKKSEDGIVAGIKFKFIDEQGKESHYTTDSNGEISISNLQVGKYQVVEEDVPAKYITPSAQTITVEENKTAVINFENKIKKVDVEIEKQDLATGKPVNGAKFKIEPLEKTSKSSPEIYTADNNGKVILKDKMIPGEKYKITEVTPPSGYMINDGVKTIETTGDKDVETVVFKNEMQEVFFDIEKTGDVYKFESGRVVADKVNLEGVEFEIIAKENITEPGTENIKFKKGEVITKLTTDEDGKASSIALPEGKYSIREVKTAPGYILDKEEKIYDIDVPDTEKTKRQKVTLTNKTEKTEFSLYKFDKDTNRKLEGAVFLITNEDGESIELHTDKDGIARIKNIPFGTYHYKEMKAPTGYIVDKTEREFIIDGSDQEARCVAVSEYNKRKESGPITGDRRSSIYAILFIGCLLLLILSWRYDKLND